MSEARIYAVVAGTVKVPRGVVVQPAGRQIAQVAHVVSKLRHSWLLNANAHLIYENAFCPVTTIVLQARDSAELKHIYDNLQRRKSLSPVYFTDTNDAVYGPGIEVKTAVAVHATQKQVLRILDYLPLWGS